MKSSEQLFRESFLKLISAHPANIKRKELTGDEDVSNITPIETKE